MNNNKEIYDGYIYLINNTINEKVYIGQTSVDIRFRWYQHKSAAKNDINNTSVLYNAINKYGFDKFNIIEICKISKNSKKELCDELNRLEIFYINQYNSLSPNGYNLTIGGDNVSIRFNVPVDCYLGDGTFYKSYDSIVEAIHDIGYDVNVSSISYCCKGKQQSCCGFVWRYKGEPFDKYPITISPEMISRYNNWLPVDKYDLYGNYINTYPTMSDALEDMGRTKYESSPIRMCCLNIYSQAYGFIWRFKGDSFDTRKINQHLDWSSVDVYDLNGKLIGEFDSINSAIRILNIHGDPHSSISSCCNGLSNTAYGYVWRYHGDDLYKFGNPYIRKHKTTHKINQYSFDNNYLDTYKSALNAGKKYNSTGDPILNCIKKGTHKSLGFYWYYADDPNQPDKTKILQEQD